MSQTDRAIQELKAVLECREKGTVDLRPLQDIEIDLILDRLAHFDGHRETTADSLGISVRSLFNKLREHRARERMREIISQCGPHTKTI